MLPDYEIAKKKSLFEKLTPIIEFIILLIIIQSVITLFTVERADEESIRFRLLAHSNAPVDQQMKEAIQQEIEPIIQQAVAASQSKEELEANLLAIEEQIVRVAQSLAGNKEITLERKEALFPPKRSGLLIYPQSNYDAYILTIGSGRGDNWWCALFPKICFPDEKEMEKEKKAENEENEVTFFVWEWIKKKFA
ncbi:stage II sporulation protein R [Sporosarcina sp. HYO08]|uniref:stage II sporulation protein R n=1 Tax=Sporosarcina sp. HYO08 TaxID=1759557 RepID=UPI0007999594|nr:stage II sporulation protein R [Sporosarcina sp. HYO08]KXH83971.1 hypothetical protein AU377_04245 [Sporosarcina sp. HYO08]